MKKQIKFLTPVNSSILPFTLTVDLTRILDIYQLKQKLSRKFYTPPQFINIIYGRKSIHNLGELLQNETLMNSLDFDHPPHIFADIRFPPRFKQSNKYQPFIVGGLDLSDIKELQHEFTKKPEPMEGGQQLDRTMQKEALKPKLQQQINLKIAKDQYKGQLGFMRDMGYTDEDKCLNMLAATNGDIAIAVELMEQQ